MMEGIAVADTALDIRFRALFNFEYFNAIQARAFDAIYGSDDNFVLAAPTGSGKTVICELAMCRLIAQCEKSSFKIVYQAPTKSLCAERQRDWCPRFGRFGLRTAEITGDSHNASLSSIQHVDIVITTPEKWDSMTRKWKDHKSLMKAVKLFLIDEVHTLRDDRGAVLEAVITRMKTISDDIRCIALSATLPNVDDICSWLGRSPLSPSLPARCEVFAADARPVALALHTHGYTTNGNHYAFDKALTAQLPSIIELYSQQQPIMIFCPTRASSIQTAQYLRDWWWDRPSSRRLWIPPLEITTTEDKDLADLLPASIAFHHGGLTLRDRKAVEAMYSSGCLSVLCCTSTLATGVNLPCHMVVVKGTTATTSSSPRQPREYSEAEVLQMLGRAGRPQFGSSAVVVIMTKMQQVDHYKALLSGGKQPVESRLHLNLLDHFNAEIVLGSIQDLPSAERWLQSTFLYTRLSKNPVQYGLSAASADNLTSHIKQISTNAIDVLREHGFIRPNEKIASTPAGTAMARYYVHFDTARLFMTLPRTADVPEILKVVSKAAELGHIFLRSGERQMLKDLDKSPLTRFPLGVHIDAPWHKSYLVLQWRLAGAQLLDATPEQGRDLACCLLFLEYPEALLKVLSLARGLAAGAWDDSSLTMSQLDGIGAAGVRKLTNAGIQSIEAIAFAEPHHLEQAFSRNPPFGSQLVKNAQQFPQLMLTARTCGGVVSIASVATVRIETELAMLNADLPTNFNGRPIRVQVLSNTATDDLLHFQTVSAAKVAKTATVSYTVKLTHITNMIYIHAMCDDIAGTQKTVTLEIDVPQHLFECLGQMRNTSTSAWARHELPKSPVDDTLHRESEFEDDGIEDGDLAMLAQPEAHNLDNQQRDSVLVRQQAEQHIQGAVPRPRLPSGKWKCNHSCKNKAICKHLCCREGLDKPPKATKAKHKMSWTSMHSASRQSPSGQALLQAFANYAHLPRSAAFPTAASVGPLGVHTANRAENGDRVEVVNRHGLGAAEHGDLQTTQVSEQESQKAMSDLQMQVIPSVDKHDLDRAMSFSSTIASAEGRGSMVRSRQVEFAGMVHAGAYEQSLKTRDTVREYLGEQHFLFLDE